MGGGDLLNLLIERDVFEEDFTRFYVAEVGTHHVLLTTSRELTLLTSPIYFLCHMVDGVAIDGPGDRNMSQIGLHSS